MPSKNEGARRKRMIHKEKKMGNKKERLGTRAKIPERGSRS